MQTSASYLHGYLQHQSNYSRETSKIYFSIVISSNQDSKFSLSVSTGPVDFPPDNKITNILLLLFVVRRTTWLRKPAPSLVKILDPILTVFHYDLVRLPDSGMTCFV